MCEGFSGLQDQTDKQELGSKVYLCAGGLFFMG